MVPEITLEKYFSPFRQNVIGGEQSFESPFGHRKIIYVDWTASGRAYRPIEERIQREMLPFVANPHTGATVTGTLMSSAYEKAKTIIKEHVHADSDDALIFCGNGMTAAVNKLQRILGLRPPERLMDYAKRNKLQFDEALRPVVFVTHMEHHSNHISWLETIADVIIIDANKKGNVDLGHFGHLLEQFSHRKNKIAAITACSNVTGIETPYHKIAKLIHRHGGLCFVDFACSAPYTGIDMHPTAKDSHLDAIYFSPHKFLGGPGAAGVLIFNKSIYTNTVPDQPGGGTVVYSNPWKVHEYVSDIEQREDGGTPPFLQGIKAAMCVRLKEEMGAENIKRREAELLKIVFERFSKMNNIEVLEGSMKQRLGVVAFMVKDVHYNLIVKMLNDRFGIQTRGGCSCAGTYGHLLLHVDEAQSYQILDSIRSGDLQCKPGWVRLSVHPTMTNAEIEFIMDAIELTAMHCHQWANDYSYNPGTNEFSFKGAGTKEQDIVDKWFKIHTPRGYAIQDQFREWSATAFPSVSIKKAM